MHRAVFSGWFRRMSVRAFLLVLTPVVASVVAALAYSGILSPSTVVQASVDVYPLRLSIELDKANFARNETVNILCKLKNISNKPVEIVFSAFTSSYDWSRDNYPYVAYFDLVIRDEEDRMIYRWGENQIFGAAFYSFTVEPGQEKSTPYWLYQGVDYSGHVKVPPGQYKITAAVPPSAGGKMNMWLNGQEMRLETPPVMFTISQ